MIRPLPILVVLLCGVSWLSTGCRSSASQSDADEDLLEAQAISFLGEPLVPPPLPLKTEREYRKNLLVAELRYRRATDQLESIVWLGRRQAYLGLYREAIETYTRGLERYPKSARLLRHRGHRFITTRNLDRAIADFKLAATLIEGNTDATEEDGLPNARNQPLSTLHFNIWYHLGLAYYLDGNFDAAVQAYERCLAVCKNPDTVCAASHWLYMSLRRLGRESDGLRLLAEIEPEMDIIENSAYHRLLLLYKGTITTDEALDEARKGSGSQLATMGYGIARHFLDRETSDRARGEQLLDEILALPGWAAFGYIAAEADVARSAKKLGNDPTAPGSPTRSDTKDRP